MKEEYFFEQTENEREFFSKPRRMTAQIQANAEEPKPPWQAQLEEFDGRNIAKTPPDELRKIRIANAIGGDAGELFEMYPSDYRNAEQAREHYRRMSDKLVPFVDQGMTDLDLEVEALHLLFDPSLRE